MTTLETILGIISIISFGLAVFSFVRNQVMKAGQQANIETIRERLVQVRNALASCAHNIDGIVQIPKTRQPSTEELQELARVARFGIYNIMRSIDDYGQELNDWRWGESLTLKQDSEQQGEGNENT